MIAHGDESTGVHENPGYAGLLETMKALQSVKGKVDKELALARRTRLIIIVFLNIRPPTRWASGSFLVLALYLMRLMNPCWAALSTEGPEEAFSLESGSFFTLQKVAGAALAASFGRGLGLGILLAIPLCSHC